MSAAVIVLAAVAGALHVFFFVLETILFAKPKYQRRFGVTDPTEGGAVTARLFAFNQGFYNLFLALGCFGGLLAPHLGYAVEGATLVLYTCAFMVGAALVLVASAPRLARAALIQGAPPLAVIILSLLA